MKCAQEIAQSLIDEARYIGGTVTWEGEDLIGETEADSRLVYGPVGDDLYAGRVGIGWFLAQAICVGGNDGFLSDLISVIGAALEKGDDSLRSNRASLHSGAAGVALAATEVGRLISDRGLQSAGRDLALRIGKRVDEGPTLQESDLIGGLAGIVLALLSIHRRSPSQVLMDACRDGCEQLICRARKDWWGWSWPERSNRPEIPALCGMAHGASGIGLALAETGWEAKEPRYLEAAQEAFRYERSWFSRENCAWPDLRGLDKDGGGTIGWMSAWCHGAIGIGAVRLRVYEVTKDLTALAEASAAMSGARALVMRAGAAMKRGEVSDVTLCHGLLGAAELFLLAREILGAEEHLRAARRVGDLALEMFRSNGGVWPVGLAGAKKIPGLFLGLAGIGTTMLRLHDPALAGSPALPGRPPASR